MQIKPQLDTIVKILTLILGPLIFIVSLVIPKFHKRIVFGEWFGQTAHDTPFQLFLHAQRLDDDVYFITKNKTLLCDNTRMLYAYSPKGLWIQLTSKVFVCNVNSRDFYPFSLTPRNILVQCGHGPAIKAAFQENLKGLDKLKNWIRINTVEKYTHALSPHESQDLNVCGQWNVPKSCVIRAPEARCDTLATNFEERRKLRDKFSIDSKALIFLYCPTHRDEGRTVNVILDARKSLERALSENYGSNYLMITKLHPYDLKHAHSLPDTTQSIGSTDTSAANLMKIADVLISDYSGIVYDFNYLKKPIICFAPDKEEYLLNSRKLLINLQDTFSRVCVDEKQLVTATKKSNLSSCGLMIDMSYGYEIGQLAQHAYKAMKKTL